MVAVVQPVAFIIPLPLSEGSELLSKNLVIAPDAGYEPVGSSAMSLDLSRRPYRRGCSVVQFPSLLELGDQFPHIRRLQLRDVAVHVHVNPSTDALVLLPRFSFLESLSIVVLSTRLSRAGAITKSLVSLFPHMPHLRFLKVYVPSMRPYVEPESGLLPYPEPPFSLERFICVGALSVRACAHIVSRSSDTLDELEITLAFDDEALVVSALAHAAPRLRKLDLGVGLSTDRVRWARVRSVFTSLSRVQRLHMESPQALPDLLDLLRGLASLRELSLACTPHLRNDSSLATAEELIASMLRMQSLRALTLHSFDLGNAARGTLLEYCLARGSDAL